MWKKPIIFVIISFFIFSLLIPLGLEHFVFRNDVYSALTNGEWGSFLGSFLGGILGSIGTLFAVYVTTSQTRDIQKENKTYFDQEQINQKCKQEKIL